MKSARVVDGIALTYGEFVCLKTPPQVLYALLETCLLKENS
jgi:hypothetical protein